VFHCCIVKYEQFHIAQFVIKQRYCKTVFFIFNFFLRCTFIVLFQCVLCNFFLLFSFTLIFTFLHSRGSEKPIWLCSSLVKRRHGDATLSGRGVCPLGILPKHRLGRVLSFSPVVGIGTPTTPHPQASVPPWFRGEGHTRWRERGWDRGRVPIPARGHTLWYSVNICTWCIE
jgi:hypothetical protein